MLTTITIRRPDDWHVHLRDGDMLATVLPFTAAQFRRAIIMPNLVPPVTTPEAARAYRGRILAALPKGSDFEPLMTCYLTDATDPDELARGHEEELFVAAKLYPAGATTNAHHGVTDLARIDKVLARMERIGMPLLMHGEATDPGVDIFDRERVFMEKQLEPLLRRHQGLKVVMEHITTAEAAAFVPAQGGRVGATITPHHLMINRNAMFAGGLRPHAYCLPVAKREHHRLALRRAATSGAPCFFLGSDTAPHRISAKEAECGCAGIFNAPIALECYAQVFAEEGALDQLEDFASINGPRFYGLPLNEGTVTLRRRPSLVASEIGGPDGLRPFLAGQETAWSLEHVALQAPAPAV
ncbi:dihydroorotase [Rhizobiales bacterium GAS191]|nr:dihydroorotase [Rhizobiales bacterium GAS191]